MFRLQISCIIIIGFLLILFLTGQNLKKGTHKLYVGLLIVSVLEIVFEMLILYCVHNIDTMSLDLCKTIHRIYLMLVMTFFYLNFRYKSAFVREEVDMQERGLDFIHVAQVILYAGIFLLPLGYKVAENGTKFTYGPGVWTMYVGAAFYLLVIFSNYCEQFREIRKEILLPLILGIAMGMLTCLVHMFFPASNISGLGIVIINIAMYISIHASEFYHSANPAEKEENDNDLKDSILYQVSFEAPNARVLIVDDSDMNRKVMKNLLQKTKMQIDEAAGGKECLELVRQNKYHLIFMDHMMPEMDGIETLEALKDEHLCEGVPVIAMTANTLMTEEEYMALGFVSYISKPILPDKLDTLVYKVLDKALMSAIEKREIAVKETEAPKEKIEEQPEKVDESWDDLPVVDGLDYTYAALHFQSPSELVEMIRFLIEVMNADLKELQGYCADLETENNIKDFCTKVHSMKNSAMTIGIVPLAGLAKTLEEDAKENKIEQILILMPVFEEKWEKYRSLLTAKFAIDHSNRISADPKSEEVQKLFSELRDAAEEMDIDALDSIMGRIDTYIFPEEYDEKIQQIRLAVMNFDIDYLQEEGYLWRKCSK